MESTTPVPNAEVQPDADMDQAMADLLKASRWMKFLSIIGFVFFGLAAIGAVLLLFAPQGSLPAAILTFFIIVFISPVLYLFNYANGIQKHQRTATPETLEAAFENQRKLWMYYGIVMLVIFIAMLGLVAFLGVNYTEALKHLR